MLNPFPECENNRGSVKAYWSPDGHRVALIVEVKGDHISGELSCDKAKWFVRGVGPQVRVTDGGAGDLATRALAGVLEKESGMSIALVAKSEKPVAKSEVYYRGFGRSHAERISELATVPLAANELGAGGWADVILVLGSDRSEPKVERFGLDGL